MFGDTRNAERVIGGADRNHEVIVRKIEFDLTSLPLTSDAAPFDVERSRFRLDVARMAPRLADRLDDAPELDSADGAARQQRREEKVVAWAHHRHVVARDVDSLEDHERGKAAPENHQPLPLRHTVSMMMMRRKLRRAPRRGVLTSRIFADDLHHSAPTR